MPVSVKLKLSWVPLMTLGLLSLDVAGFVLFEALILWWIILQEEPPSLGLQQLLLYLNLVLWDPWVVLGVQGATQEIVSIAEKWTQPYFLFVYWSLRATLVPATVSENCSVVGLPPYRGRKIYNNWKCMNPLGREALEFLLIEHRKSHTCVSRWGNRTLSRA